jgi:glycerol-3-phosphate acyltransferase PlsX
MGGDRAPAEIVAGALRAAEEFDVRILLVGTEPEVAPLLPASGPPDGVALLATTEVIAMDDEPASAVRSRKDSSIVQAAKAVRDGRADAMVGAGNTGATMAAALLRMGRMPGVKRPAIGVPIPTPGRPPQLLVDGGAAVDVAPEWLVTFARLGQTYARVRWGIAEPRLGLLSNGEEPGKGDQLRKDAFGLLEKEPHFVGNVEGREFFSNEVDVIVTDGFTGNVALKTIEGALTSFASTVLSVFETSEETRKAGEVLMGPLMEAVAPYVPDNTGGAILLGVKGVCVISHGSSSATAITNAVRVAAEAVTSGTIEQLAEAVR